MRPSWRFAALALAASAPLVTGAFVSAGAADPHGPRGTTASASAARVLTPTPAPGRTPVPTAGVTAVAGGQTLPASPSFLTGPARAGAEAARPREPGPIRPAAPARTVPPSTTTAPPIPAPAGYQGKWGVFVPDFPGSLTTIDALQSAVHRTADYVMWYVHWAGPYSRPNPAVLAAVAGNGSTPVVTWMSDDPTGATTITDAAIAAGAYDAYIRAWADGLRSFGHPVLLRFDHEMNGNWYGWSPGTNGNTAAGFVAAWRHVYGLFARAGATNVTFVWSPNVDYTGATPLAQLYPGDAYVGMVAVDGYNWGPLNGHTWQTPQQVFGPTIATLAALSTKPLLIGEVGSTSVGGDKAAWITSFISMLESDRSISGFVWFDMDKETDWAVSQPFSILSVFAGALSGR